MRDRVEMTCPINMAIIKYWGKLCQTNNIPLNSSLSVTLSTDHFYSRTVIELNNQPEDTFVLQDLTGKIIEEGLPRHFGMTKDFFVNYLVAQDSNYNPKAFFVRVSSVNSFPTKAGMASSASGRSCLVLAFCRLVNFFDESDQEASQNLLSNIKNWFATNDRKRIEKVYAISHYLRIKSGSSARSIFPGLVLCTGPDIRHHYSDSHIDSSITNEIVSREKTSLLKGAEIVAKLMPFKELNLQYFSQMVQKYKNVLSIPDIIELLDLNQELNSKVNVLPILEMNNLSQETLAKFLSGIQIICVVKTITEKEVGSTDGMVVSSLTSELLVCRVANTPLRLEELLKAISAMDYPAFNRAIMRESSNFHATCLDTYPPLFYLNQFSAAAIAAAHKFNAKEKMEVVGYTFDAGPNPFFFVQKKYTQSFVDFISQQLSLEPKDLVLTEIMQ